MKMAIMQPYFMPYIGYFQAISAVDKYILYSNLTLIKEAWMNRNRILLKDGRVQTIMYPLQHKSSNTMIYDTKIDNSKPWCKKLQKTIQFNYNDSEYYDEVFPLLESILFNRKYDFLTDLNATTICAIADFLDIHTEIEFDNTRFLEMEEVLAKIEDDYSLMPYLKSKPVRKVARVLEMCRREGCNDFVNAIGGMELYSKEEFSQYGIELSFVKTHDISYHQIDNHTFEPNLSIIDVLMHNGKEGTKRLLNEYSLI